MKIPCDECEIKDICRLVGSVKHAANKVDQLLKEVDDEFLEIPVVCTRRKEKQDPAAVQSEQNTTVGGRADADRSLQDEMRGLQKDDHAGRSNDKLLLFLPPGTVDSERKRSQTTTDGDKLCD